MLVSQIDYNLIADIIEMKKAVQESVEAVMEDRLTAGHLASDVYRLLEMLDKLEDMWRATPPTEEMALAEAAQAEQPAQKTPSAEALQPEQPAPEG